MDHDKLMMMMMMLIMMSMSQVSMHDLILTLGQKALPWSMI